MPRLVSELTKGNAVVAVGALHLPSDDGLLALLEDAGFRITPLPDPWLVEADDTLRGKPLNKDKR